MLAALALLIEYGYEAFRGCDWEVVSETGRLQQPLEHDGAPSKTQDRYRRTKAKWQRTTEIDQVIATAAVE